MGGGKSGVCERRSRWHMWASVVFRIGYWDCERLSTTTVALTTRRALRSCETLCSYNKSHSLSRSLICCSFIITLKPVNTYFAVFIVCYIIKAVLVCMRVCNYWFVSRICILGNKLYLNKDYNEKWFDNKIDCIYGIKQIRTASSTVHHIYFLKIH